MKMRLYFDIKYSFWRMGKIKGRYKFCMPRSLSTADPCHNVLGKLTHSTTTLEPRGERTICRCLDQNKNPSVTSLTFKKLSSVNDQFQLYRTAALCLPSQAEHMARTGAM